MDRLPGAGKVRSDQLLFIKTGGVACGVGIERLGNGGNRFTPAGRSTGLLTGIYNVGTSGALQIGSGPLEKEPGL
jgi:hypothetical protein